MPATRIASPRLLLVVSLSVLARSACLACGCDEPFDPREDFLRSDVVFEGFALSVEHQELPLEVPPVGGGDQGADARRAPPTRRRVGVYRCRVRRSWKGDPPEVLELLVSQESGGRCRWEPGLRRTYVFFAQRQPGGRLRVTPCGRSRVSTGWLTEALDRITEAAGAPVGPSSRSEAGDGAQ